MNRKNKNENIAVQIILWTAVACAVALALSAIAAYLITVQILPQGSVGVVSRCVAAVALFFSIALAVRGKGREVRWVLGIGVCTGYLLVTFLCKLAFFPGPFKQPLVHVAVCALASAVSVLLLNGRKSRRRMVALKRRR